MNTEQLLSRLLKAEKTLAEAERNYNQLEGKLASLRENLKQITGEYEDKSSRILLQWEKSLQQNEEKLEALLDKIEFEIEEEETEDETED